MAIRVVFPPNGTPYAEADTPEEAAALLRLNSNGHSPTKREWPKLDVEPLPELRMSQFFLMVNDNARKLMLALVKHEKGVRGDEFAEETGIASEKVGGILGGASKIAKKFNLRFEQLVRSEMVVKGSDRYRFFRPCRLLLENADALKQAAKDGAVRLE
jgi:hypothetical protein